MSEQINFEGKTLVQKLALIMGAVSYVQKKGYNAHHKYKFVREADLVDAVRPLLADAGIVMLPNVKFQERVGTLTRLVYEYTITDGTSTLTTSSLGEGSDAQDKAGYKAMTGAQKYALYKLFQIATGDDPEESEPEVPRAAQVAPRQSKQAAESASVSVAAKLLEAVSKANSELEIASAGKQVADAKQKGLLTTSEVDQLREKFAQKTARK